MKMYRDSRLGLCIDLRGPEGNVFALMGIGQDLARQLKKCDKLFIEDCKKQKDYDGVLTVFEAWFGHVVTLINKPGEEDYDEESET